MQCSCEDAPSLYTAAERARLRLCAPGTVAVAAISGRDSVAAIIRAALDDPALSVIVPTSVGTGTEHGDVACIAQAVTVLRERVALLSAEGRLAHPIEVLDVQRFGSPDCWAALNGAPAVMLQETYGMNSPCLACHLYLHLCRVPLCLSLKATKLITGERDTHDGRIKLSQTADSIDAEIRIVARAGIALLAPLRTLSGDEIATLVPDWPEGTKQIRCVHSGNYRRADGTVAYDRAAHRRYLAGFFEPQGNALVDGWVAASK